MSGARYNRRDFLKLSLLAGGAVVSLPSFFSCSSSSENVPITNAEKNRGTAHMLRSNNFPEPKHFDEIETVIVGGGISALAAARRFSQNGYHNYILLDLAEKTGGNAAGGKNTVSRYPWAAHYLPIPNDENKELLSFLQEAGILTHYSESGLPFYHEEYLCQAPHERLFIHGRWQHNLVPETGLSSEDLRQIKSFTNLTEEYRFKKDSEGKYFFDLPVENSSKEAIAHFDGISFAEFLKSAKLNSEYLLWHLDYCCRDDFGGGIEKVSAFAGLHYFASRRGKAANAENNAVLTRPEGNEFLAEKLLEQAKGKIKTQSLVYSVLKMNDEFEVKYYEAAQKISRGIKAKKVILCTPQYVNDRIVRGVSSPFSEAKDLLAYYPWFVANITVRNNVFDPHNEVSWDNVFYGSQSLGYVHARHQLLDLHSEKTVITYYHALCNASPKEERAAARNRSQDEWKEFIFSNFKKAHPGFKEAVIDLEYKILGHGMICPVPGLMKILSERKQDETGIAFAHSDTGGISVFEQAFYSGGNAAEKILTELNWNAEV